jgi:hypothetical protein
MHTMHTIPILGGLLAAAAVAMTSPLGSRATGAAAEGPLYFATGTLAGDMKREVNDQDFDVSLLMIFASKAAHDKYQEHPRHLKFVEDNKENWEKVRVFDSYLSPAPAAE